MNIELTKAKAFEIDPSRSYLVVIELPARISKEEVNQIKESVNKEFKKHSIHKNQLTTLIVYGGSIQINEVQHHD